MGAGVEGRRQSRETRSNLSLWQQSHILGTPSLLLSSCLKKPQGCQNNLLSVLTDTRWYAPVSQSIYLKRLTTENPFCPLEMYPYLLQLMSVFLKDLRGLKDLWDVDLYPQSLWGQNPPWEPCQQQTQLITFTDHCLTFQLSLLPIPPPFSPWKTQSPLCQSEWSSALSLTVSGYWIKSVFTV